MITSDEILVVDDSIGVERPADDVVVVDDGDNDRSHRQDIGDDRQSVSLNRRSHSSNSSDNILHRVYLHS